MRGIPIDILRAFVAVVESRGFTRAAEELGRTQPTISLQVKRLEELLEAPLFKKGGRFELSSVGEICFDYGKRLLRLHDDMLDELGRNSLNDAMRVGMPSEFAPILAPRLDALRADAEDPTTFEVIVDSSQALSAAFRQNALDVAFVVGTGESEPHRIEQWRGQLRWFGQTLNDEQDDRPLAVVLPPQGSPFHEAAIERAARSGTQVRDCLRFCKFWRARSRRRGRSWRHPDDRRARARGIGGVLRQGSPAFAGSPPAAPGAFADAGARQPPLGRKRGRSASIGMNA